MSDYTNILSEKRISTPTPRELLFRYLPFVPWVILSLVITLGAAWLKLRYSTPIYNVTGKILVKDQNPYDNNAGKFGNILGLSEDNTNLNNEIEIIKSRLMASRVARTLGFQQSYAFKGKILVSEAHEPDMPFSWLIEKLTDSAQTVSLLVSVASSTQFKINEDPKLYNFGQVVNFPFISFRLIPNKPLEANEESMQYVMTWQPIDRVASGLAGGIKVLQQEGARVLNVSYSTSNFKNGLEIVNAYMEEYQQSSLEDKKQIALNTIQFIDEQLDTLHKELGGVERNLQKFREDNRVFNPETQASVTFAQITETQKTLAEQGVKLKVIDYLRQYVGDARNNNKLVPSNLGIEEPSLAQQVTAFNQLQLQKETALRTTTEENQLIKNYNASLDKLRSDISQNLNNIRGAYVLSIGELNKLSGNSEKSILSIPGKEKQLLEVTRRQAILQELYSFLLQKKLETAISSASTISDIKILEPAIVDMNPVSPNRRGLYTIAIFLGLAIPVGLIVLLEYLNDKISSRADLEKITDAPILGEVGHAEDFNTLVVKDGNRSYIAEQFRIIRSNLRYILPKNEKPIILVTSTFSGEGKSFVSTNLGAAIALSGKKTVVLEMDIRKPKILRGLGMNERKGISNYIVSDIRVDDIIYKVNEIEGLYVVPCGPVPPNPAEMLLDEKVSDLFSELSRRFDTIIIDSAPVGLVGDAVSLGAYANTSVYIVRHSYTLKKQVQFIDDLFNSKKLPHLSIVINDIEVNKGYGSYYGYGYGYGGGYGFGNRKGGQSDNSYFDFGRQRYRFLGRLFKKKK